MITWQLCNHYSNCVHEKQMLLAFSKAVWWWVTRSIQPPKARLFCSGHQWSAVHSWQTDAVVSQNMPPGHLSWTASKK